MVTDSMLQFLLNTEEWFSLANYHSQIIAQFCYQPRLQIFMLCERQISSWSDDLLGVAYALQIIEPMIWRIGFGDVLSSLSIDLVRMLLLNRSFES